MTPLQTERALRHLITRKVPVFLWGPPGIGKSSIVAQIAKEAGIGCIDLRLSLLDPTDLRGIPFFNPATQEAVWADASFLPDGSIPEGILFLDELNTAAPMVQAAAYQLILDRKIGEYTLPEGWAIVAAGNRESDRGVTFRMAAPLANRFVHIEMEHNLNDWRVWALKSGIHSSIIGFLSHRPDALFNFGNAGESRAFATPRTWAYVHEIIASEPESELLLPLISGAVGEELASAYLGFRLVAGELPDIESIFIGEAAVVPTEPAALHLLASALTQRVDDATSSKRLENLVAYTLKLPAEFAVQIIEDLRARHIELDHLSSWPLWMKKFNHLLR